MDVPNPDGYTYVVACPRGLEAATVAQVRDVVAAHYSTQEGGNGSGSSSSSSSSGPIPVVEAAPIPGIVHVSTVADNDGSHATLSVELVQALHMLRITEYVGIAVCYIPCAGVVQGPPQHPFAASTHPQSTKGGNEAVETNEQHSTSKNGSGGGDGDGGKVQLSPEELEASMASVFHPLQTQAARGRIASVVASVWRKSYPHPTPIVFRVSTERREKSMPFNQHDVNVHVGFAVGAHFPPPDDPSQPWADEDRWLVNLLFYTLDVRVVVDAPASLVALVLSGPNVPRAGVDAKIRRELVTKFANRQITVDEGRNAVPQPSHFKNEIRVEKGKNSMHPAIAHALCHYARIQPSDIVFDPMGGTGSTALEGQLAVPSSIVISADVDMTDCRRAAANLANCSKGASERGLISPAQQSTMVPGMVIRHDASRCCLRDGIVDVIVCDMPFGVRCNSRTRNEKMYPSLLSEMIRVLRPGTGRLVLLTLEQDLLMRAVANYNVYGGKPDWVAQSSGKIAPPMGKKKRKRLRALAEAAGSSAGVVEESPGEKKETTASGALPPKHTLHLATEPFPVDMNGLFPLVFVLQFRPNV